MKIIRLKSSNVMRLTAIDITPDGHLVTIGGRNGAGKSSVLNSIAMALGGKAMCPAEPIREGEMEAKIEVDLGDLKVTRKFRRERVDAAIGGQGTEFIPPTYGEMTSTLVVTNKDGATYPSPQAMLDKLLGKLTFDPLAFSREDPPKQDVILRKLINLDVSAFETERKDAYDQRTLTKKTLSIKESQLLALPHHDKVPSTEISVDEIALAINKAAEYRKLADDADHEVEKVKSRVTVTEKTLATTETKIENLQHQLTLLQNEANALVGVQEDLKRELEAKQTTAQAAHAVVPDIQVIQQQLQETETTNRKVRENLTHLAKAQEVHALAEEVKSLDTKVEQAVLAKRQKLEEAKFPIEGLGLNDNGVSFDGIPFSQASTAEQLRVSVAIGLALNPTLKVLLIRSGNLLDEDSMAAVAQQAEAADAQVWMEYVTKDASDVQVMIEEGHVVEPSLT